MTHDALVQKLQDMLACATSGVDVTATVLLFGVLFNNEIRDSGSNGSRIADAVDKDCNAMITDGQKLAQLKFVIPAPDMLRRWKS